MSFKNDLDISSSDFWDDCYIRKDTGWDLGSPTPIFMDWCDRLKERKNICVPGCGNGYDVLYFSQKGHKVTAIDFAQNPIKKIKKESQKNNLKINVIQKNIFDLSSSLNGKFDYIIEYTCYCAIDPIMRSKYVDVMYDLLMPGGELVGVFLPIGKDLKDGGPPFGLELQETIDLFLNKFELIESVKHSLSIYPRLDKEQFIRFKK